MMADSSNGTFYDPLSNPTIIGKWTFHRILNTVAYHAADPEIRAAMVKTWHHASTTPAPKVNRDMVMLEASTHGVPIGIVFQEKFAIFTWPFPNFLLTMGITLLLSFALFVCCTRQSKKQERAHAGLTVVVEHRPDLSKATGTSQAPMTISTGTPINRARLAQEDVEQGVLNFEALEPSGTVGTSKKSTMISTSTPMTTGLAPKQGLRNVDAPGPSNPPGPPQRSGNGQIGFVNQGFIPDSN